MNSFQDFSVFNSVNPDTITPKIKKPLPFPLENIDESIADVYAKLDRIMAQLHAAKQNPVNGTKAKQKRIAGVMYKIDACMKMVKTADIQIQELWF